MWRVPEHSGILGEAKEAGKAAEGVAEAVEGVAEAAAEYGVSPNSPDHASSAAARSLVSERKRPGQSLPKNRLRSLPGAHESGSRELRKPFPLVDSFPSSAVCQPAQSSKGSPGRSTCQF
jgi:hypothetical protein